MAEPTTTPLPFHKGNLRVSIAPPIKPKAKRKRKARPRKSYPKERT